jgi:hypothetical protein
MIMRVEKESMAAKVSIDRRKKTLFVRFGL